MTDSEAPRKRPVPQFKSEEEEIAWLESQEGREYFADAEAQAVEFAPKHPNRVSVTMRLEPELRDRMRRLASRVGMGYQTLARQWLFERCEQEERRDQEQSASAFRRLIETLPTSPTIGEVTEEEQELLSRFRAWLAERGSDYSEETVRILFLTFREAGDLQHLRRLLAS